MNVMENSSPTKAVENSVPFPGVWVTMITPFHSDLSVDYSAVEQLVEWYILRGVTGIFAVCQSSESECLTRRERRELAAFVVRAAAGRVPVAVSGHVSDSFDEQLRDFDDAQASGADAVILVSNRFADAGDSSDLFLARLTGFLTRIDPAVPLGMYECPSPYKRLLTAKEVKYCADTGRFCFFKDTSCSLDRIAEKVEAARNSPLNIYNANAATLLHSLQFGAAGYSGVMANYHPELYRWLCRNFRDNPPLARELSDFLSIASMSECRVYPSSAKYHLSRFIPMNWNSRKVDCRDLIQSFQMEMDAVEEMAQRFREKCGLA